MQNTSNKSNSSLWLGKKNTTRKTNAKELIKLITKQIISDQLLNPVIMDAPTNERLNGHLLNMMIQDKANYSIMKAAYIKVSDYPSCIVFVGSDFQYKKVMTESLKGYITERLHGTGHTCEIIEKEIQIYQRPFGKNGLDNTIQLISLYRFYDVKTKTFEEVFACKTQMITDAIHKIATNETVKRFEEFYQESPNLRDLHPVTSKGEYVLEAYIKSNTLDLFYVGFYMGDLQPFKEFDKGFREYLSKKGQMGSKLA
jgi:hypothetical protein